MKKWLFTTPVVSIPRRSSAWALWANAWTIAGIKAAKWKKLTPSLSSWYKPKIDNSASTNRQDRGGSSDYWVGSVTWINKKSQHSPLPKYRKRMTWTIKKR